MNPSRFPSLRFCRALALGAAALSLAGCAMDSTPVAGAAASSPPPAPVFSSPVGAPISDPGQSTRPTMNQPGNTGIGR